MFYDCETIVADLVGRREVLVMKKDAVAHGHLWRVRELRVDEETYLHRHCLHCQRDLILHRRSTEWKAAHLGAFRFDYLDEETSLRWLIEDCPGKALPARQTATESFRKHRNDRRVRADR